jgi:hypothetical protein
MWSRGRRSRDCRGLNGPGWCGVGSAGARAGASTGRGEAAPPGVGCSGLEVAASTARAGDTGTGGPAGRGPSAGKGCPAGSLARGRGAGPDDGPAVVPGQKETGDSPKGAATGLVVSSKKSNAARVGGEESSEKGNVVSSKTTWHEMMMWFE